LCGEGEFAWCRSLADRHFAPTEPEHPSQSTPNLFVEVDLPSVLPLAALVRHFSADGQGAEFPALLLLMTKV
jgi:hypothetical protein